MRHACRRIATPHRDRGRTVRRWCTTFAAVGLLLPAGTGCATDGTSSSAAEALRGGYAARADQAMRTTGPEGTSGFEFPTNQPPRSLVLPTDELRRLLAERSAHPGFDVHDWEYGRNDTRVGIPPDGVASREESGAFAVIEYYDRIGVSSDRPRTYTERVIRSGQIRNR